MALVLRLIVSQKLVLDTPLCAKAIDRIREYTDRKSSKGWGETLSGLRALQKRIENWHKEQPEKRKKIKDTIEPLVEKHAIVLICAHFLPDGLEKGVLKKLEIDHRGKSITTTLPSPSPSPSPLPSPSPSPSPSSSVMKCRVFQMGESKSGKNVAYGVQQLFIRLYLVGKVSEWISPEILTAGEGVLICPRNQNLEEIVNATRKLHLDELWSKRISIHPMLIGGRGFSSD